MPCQLAMQRTTHPASFLPAASLFLLTCATLTSSQFVDVSWVRTAQQLKEAMDRGAAHIEIIDHLDLTALDPSPNSQPGFPELFITQRTTRSIRGNCASKPTFPVLEPPLAPRTEGQCVLLVRYQLLHDESAGTGLWLDKLLVRTLRPDPLPSSESTMFLARIMSKPLWATNITLQGDGRESSNGIAAWHDVYMADSTMLYFAGSSALYIVDEARISLVNSVVTDNSVGTATIFVDGELRLEGCEVAGNHPADLEIAAGSVFSDDVTSLTVRDEAMQASVKPLYSIPATSPFPKADDPDFLTLQAEVEELLNPTAETVEKGGLSKRGSPAAVGLVIAFLITTALLVGFVFRNGLKRLVGKGGGSLDETDSQQRRAHDYVQSTISFMKVNSSSFKVASGDDSTPESALPTSTAGVAPGGFLNPQQPAGARSLSDELRSGKFNSKRSGNVNIMTATGPTSARNTAARAASRSPVLTPPMEPATATSAAKGASPRDGPSDSPRRLGAVDEL